MEHSFYAMTQRDTENAGDNVDTDFPPIPYYTSPSVPLRVSSTYVIPETAEITWINPGGVAQTYRYVRGFYSARDGEHAKRLYDTWLLPTVPVAFEYTLVNDTGFSLLPHVNVGAPSSFSGYSLRPSLSLSFSPSLQIARAFLGLRPCLYLSLPILSCSSTVVPLRPSTQLRLLYALYIIYTYTSQTYISS